MEWVKKHKIPFLLNLILVLLSAACLFGFIRISGTLDHTRSAEFWKGEGELDYAYISAFFPVNGKTDEGTVRSFEKTVESKLVEASVTASENGKLWNYAYSGTGMVEVSTERGSAKVNAVGVGGDFFFFHRPFLKDGNYISGTDVMRDCVVLEKELAWKLFGATDVAGMEVLINGSRYLVSGVTEAQDDFASKAAKTADGGIYMAFEKLEELTGAGIDCYEAVIPNPVKGFAKNIVSKNFPSENFETVEVSKRYALGNIFSVAGSFGKRSMRTDGIIYPEWENAARLTEDYCAGLLLMGIAFAITPFCFSAVLIHRNGKIYGKKLFVYAKEKAEKIYDDHNRRIYEKNLAKKQK